MKRVIGFVLAAILLTGCGSEEKLRNYLDLANGHTEDELVSKLGPPDKVYQVDTANTGSAKYLSYTRGQTSVMPGYGNTYCFRGSCSTVYTPAQQYTNVCTITFRVEGGIVRSHRFEGNACRM